MFTGIVTAVGTVRERRDTAEALEFTVEAAYDGVQAGESIAVNGACLTAVDPGPDAFSVQVVASTADRTTFGALQAGARVNLERALALGDRLGGHWVQGHVDGVGTIRARHENGETLLMDINIPLEVYERTVPRGSITVDGVSLTVNDLLEDNGVQVSLIPFTRNHTTLGQRQPGERVHIEGDVLGAYVQRLMTPRLNGK